MSFDKRVPELVFSGFMALAHTIGSKVEAAYRRGDLFEKRRQLMADWGAYCGPVTVDEGAS